MQALFQGKESFMQSIRDSPAFIKAGTGDTLQMPQVYTFDIDELAKYGVELFRNK